MKRILLSAVLLFTPIAAPAQQGIDGNPEMAAIFAADQAARGGGLAKWETEREADAQRRARTRELLEQGALTTGPDYLAAAFVFQHGETPDDYLLAHALAVRALGLGLKDAEWIAAATLDRYLQSTGKGQIYGTQFSYSPADGTKMDPYDRNLLTDSLRVAAGAHSLAEQEAKLPEMRGAAQPIALPPADP